MPINAQILDNPKSDRVRRVAELTNRKARERSGRFLIEGPQSVREAVMWHPEIVSDLYVEAVEGERGPRIDSETLRQIVESAQHNGKGHAQAKIYVHPASREVMHRISPDCQGIAAVGNAEAMQSDAHNLHFEHKPFIAAFWQVRDPGNAGTVIRAADAAGCDAVVFIDDCVDTLNPKVIRSTAGSLFHIPVVRMGTDEFFTWSAEHSITTIAADVYGVDQYAPVELPELLESQRDMLHDAKAVIFGNEARGLEAELLRHVDHIVRIPLYGKAESLNLATSAAIMLMSMAMSSHIGTM
ncbi:rRNA methylase [Bifidobacterium goeldii]|uniref:rRNA methylase n=1 Tax=Bifidobacterium goeldii TaxID=2306975 RepID=A0A430FKD1_9BIFI|nr:RNA methyltransferase [Bifidobacterium goeldii]RSX53201.1 rRNA methylase [Bifidobacterium goeldii]